MSDTPETDAFANAMYSTGVDCHHDGREALKHAERLERERDEARELCRELVDLVAYGLGQNGSFWSQKAMRQAREAIQKAKAQEAAK